MNDTQKDLVPRNFSERRQHYIEHFTFPYTPSWIKEYPLISAVFNLLRHSRLSTVAELGCNDGGLAVKCLRDNSYPLKWIGYDFLKQHIERSHWHPSYKPVLMDKYLWEMSEVQPFDIFVASHVMEHLYPEEIQQLAVWLAPRAKHLIMVAPLGHFETAEHAARSGHILTKGSSWISDVLQNVGFVPVWETGRWFGWFQKK